MILPCPLCQARFNVPDEKVTGPGTKIQCPKCKFTFVIKAPGASVASETPRTDTDPAIDPALAKAVADEARQEGHEGEGTLDKAARLDTIETKIPPDATPEQAAAGQATLPMSSTPAVDATGDIDAHRGGGTGGAEVTGAPISGGVDDSAEDDISLEEDDASATEVDIDPALARKVLEEAQAQAPDAVAELEFEEIEPEAHALSPEELAKIPDAEIVDADDLAQLAETAGETEVKGKLSPKVEAEAAGQWPSIIVDDPLLDGEASDAQTTGKDTSKAGLGPDATAPGVQRGATKQPTPSQAAPLESRQALETAQKRAQAAQRAVDQLMNAQNVAQAQQQLTAAQAELQRAMAQLQAAQQAYLAAQQRLAATAQAASQASTAATPSIQGPGAPGADHAKAGVFTPSYSDSIDDDVALGKPTSHGRGLLIGLVAVALVGAMVLFLVLRGKDKDSPQAKAVPSAADSKIWQGLTVEQRSIQVLPRHNSPSLVVVNVVLRNTTSDYRYENPYISGILTSGGSKIDEGVAPCGARLSSSVIVSVIKARGRQGYYNRLRKFVLASDETQRVPPKGSLPCQILFFDSTGHKTSRGLRVELHVDRDKTIAAPVK